MCNKLSTSFLANPAVKAFLQVMTERSEPVRRNELLSHLRALHPLATITVFNELHANGMFPGFTPPPRALRKKLQSNAIKAFKATTKIKDEKVLIGKNSDALFATFEAAYTQTQLILKVNMKDRDKKAHLIFLIDDFPNAYLMALDKLVHYDWYVACFTARPDNHFMWSTYADGHRGVCLMFKTTTNESGNQFLKINRITGAGASKNGPTTYSKSFVSHSVQPVIYSSEHPEIDFFRSLGRISQMDMNNFWYHGEDGKSSICASAIYEDENAWRIKYWETFTKSTLYKTPEWKHEEEYRISAHSMLFDMQPLEQRKLQYRFEDLEGIVFGARTSTETKLKILEIIDRKCAKIGRNDFRFFEARYSSRTSYSVHELSLIKLKHSMNRTDTKGA